MTSRFYAERVVGAYPLSIATSLAIEGALGVHPDRPTGKDELNGNDVIWVNVKTIFRNFHNAMNKDDISKCHPDEWGAELLREMETFKDIVSSVGRGMQVQYYLPNYSGLESRFKHAVLRSDVTPNQIEYSKRMKAVITELLKLRSIEVKIYPLFITDKDDQKVLMLTHVAPDLLTSAIRNKKLLESHTGAVKPSSMWYTKYHSGQTLTQIPFRLDLVQVFGDNELFRPWNIKAKEAVLELANKYNWSQVTSTAKIRYSIEQLKDHLLRRTLLEMLES